MILMFIKYSKRTIWQKEFKNSRIKYFIGYNDNDVIRPLCVRLPQMTGYDRTFNENATISFKASNKQLLKNYNKIWEKVEKLKIHKNNK